MASSTAHKLCSSPLALTRPVAAASSRCARLVVRAQQERPATAVESRVFQIQSWASSVVKPVSLVAAANALAALPAHEEAGKIFDFGLTMPIMVTEFLILMVFLDKAWFGPVGKILDERDAFLREKLGSVKDNSGELKNLQQQAEKVLAEARAEAQKVIQAAKSEVQAEQNKKLADTKERIDKELASAISQLDSEKEDALKNLDEQVNKLAGEILERVLPEGVKV